VEVFGNGAPGAVGQRCVALLPSFQMPWVDRAGQIRQGLSGWSESKFAGLGLSSIAAGIEHLIDPLWDSLL
jgi:hypothetical protein